MRYSLKNYAEALAAAIYGVELDRKDAIIRNFLALLRKSGDETHAEKIVGATEHILHKKDGLREIVFESARPLERANRKLLSEIAKTKDVIALRVNPDLVAGVRIVIDGEREFDGSLKGKLDKIFSA
jgi:F0F1-type ATP synthase delta subunit